MSDSQSRPPAPRGRGSGRGGRGGYSSSRGGRSKHTNGDTADTTPTISYEDQGEIGQLKKKYALPLMTIKEMFPDYTEDDIVFALDESNGDMERTVERMTEGNVSQWGEVKKKSKDKVTAKSKDVHADSGEIHLRGSRSRGDGARGGRPRGTERGRGRGRVRDSGTTRKAAESTSEIPSTAGDSVEVPAESQPASDPYEHPAPTTTSEESGWDVVNSAEAPPAAAIDQPQTSSKPDGTRTWASMFAQKPKPKPVIPTQKAASKPTASESTQAQTLIPDSQATVATQEPPVEEAAATLPSHTLDPDPVVEITPSENQLTESNLQQVPGSPQEPATATVVSNAGTNEVRTASGAVTPIPGTTPAQQPVRPGLGGFQTSALKATTATPRTPSFARRVKEQHESVVMPGNHAVDRTAVQFGSLGLGTSSADLDADDDREQPETRAQPPQHSPVAPKASLPIVAQQSHVDATKPSSGLAAPGTQPSISQDQTSTQSTGQAGYPYNQFGNIYGHPGHPDNTSTQKGYEAFSQQAGQHAGSSNGYQNQSQTPGQSAQSATQSHPGGFSSAGNDYSSYYTSDQRNAYNLYGSYGQAPQDPSQKTSTAFGATSASELPATVATSQAPHPSQTRFGNVDQNSGHSTPNLPNTTQAQSQGQQSQQVNQTHSNQHTAYAYGASSPYYGNYYPNYMGQHSYGGRDRPPFDDVRRYEEQFLNQSHHYGYGANQGSYGAGPYGGGKYGQPHQAYGMPSQAWDGHSGSPANTGSYGTSRDTTNSQATYGRTSSTQPSEGQQQSSTTFSGIPDVFGRSGSTYGAQGAGQPTTSDDVSRGYGDSSKTTGPSPAPGQNAGRPSSAANVGGQGAQGQSPQNYGYPGHGQQSHYGSSYGHQNTTQGHQTGGYGAYAGFGNNYYGGNNSRGNWSGNYGH